MNLAGQIYKLQQADLEIERKQQALDEIENNLRDNRGLLIAKSKLTTQEQQLAEAKKNQKVLEWELEDLQEKIKRASRELYSGKTKNPKELMNLENEVKSLKIRVGGKEEELLELMAQAEGMETEVKASDKEVEKLQWEWQQSQEILNQRKAEIKVELNKISEFRQELAQPLDPENLRLYEHLRLAKGQAVVKVEQGRCQGCRISLPTSQWQRVKGGELVQCNNCNRILYTE